MRKEIIKFELNEDDAYKSFFILVEWIKSNNINNNFYI